MDWKRRLSARRCVAAGLFIAALVASGGAGWAIITDLDLVRLLEGAAVGPHANQAFYLAMVQNGQPHAAFESAFERGDRLFETELNAADGAGANVGGGARFTRMPRTDLTGPTEWASHLPPRTTGPNGSSCLSCHNRPTRDGAGFTAANVVRDTFRSGDASRFIQRNAMHVFGAGAVQRLAEEMTATLQRLRGDATAEACANGQASRELAAKGVSFGRILVTRTAAVPCEVQVGTAEVAGVGADLVVRPFQWKGSVAFLREFVRKAANDELGLQAAELVGARADADFDGVADELSVGDVTALALYVAAQPRPTTRLELADLHLIPPLSEAERLSIARGSQVFRQVSCNSCHAPRLTIDDPVFAEPSRDPGFRDPVFPAGQDPLAEALDPNHPMVFDLTRQQPENVLLDANDHVIFRLGSFRRNAAGKTIVQLYGDLKRHDMGPGLAEPIDETGTGASTFLTRNLWGVGTTAPYLHDGRATTLTEAILEHGGEAAAVRDAFERLAADQQRDLLAFLKNLVLFKRTPLGT